MTRGSEVECAVLSPPFSYYHSSFQHPPPKIFSIPCHPLGGGGWGSTAVVKKLMPMFNRRWVQCVRGRGRDRRGRGEGRGWLRKLLEGGEGKRGRDPPQ